jgi:hypothetical protein
MVHDDYLLARNPENELIRCATPELGLDLKFPGLDHLSHRNTGFTEATQNKRQDR